MSDPKLTFLLTGEVSESTEVSRHKLADVRMAVAANDAFTWEADVPPATTLSVAMGAVSVAEFLAVIAEGGDLSAAIVPEAGGTPLVFRADQGLFLFGARVRISAVSSVSGCHAVVLGASK